MISWARSAPSTQHMMNPIKYLESIGETSSPSTAEMAKAEQYLVKIYADTWATPNASVVQAHIRRGVFLIYKICSSLNPDAQELDPMAYCFEKLFGVLVPMKSLNPLPKNMTKTCTCSGKCGDKRCTCVSLGNKCVLFCHRNCTGGLCRNRIR